MGKEFNLDEILLEVKSNVTRFIKAKKGEARGGKYLSREWKNDHWVHKYASKVTPAMSSFFDFFGVKEKKEANKIVRKDFEESKLKIPFSIFQKYSFDYFLNKAKVDKVFESKKAKESTDSHGKEKTATDPKTAGSKLPSDPKEKKPVDPEKSYRSQVFKFLNSKYGNLQKSMAVSNSKPVQVETKPVEVEAKQKEEAKENNFETMPERELLEKAGLETPEINTFLREDKTGWELAIRGIFQGIKYRYEQSSPFVMEMDAKSEEEREKIFQDIPNLKEVYKEGKLNIYVYNKYKDNFETMPDAEPRQKYISSLNDYLNEWQKSDSMPGFYSTITEEWKQNLINEAMEDGATEEEIINSIRFEFRSRKDKWAGQRFNEFKKEIGDPLDKNNGNIELYGRYLQNYGTENHIDLKDEKYKRQAEETARKEREYKEATTIPDRPKDIQIPSEIGGIKYVDVMNYDPEKAVYSHSRGHWFYKTPGLDKSKGISYKTKREAIENALKAKVTMLKEFYGMYGVKYENVKYDPIDESLITQNQKKEIPTLKAIENLKEITSPTVPNSGENDIGKQVSYNGQEGKVVSEKVVNGKIFYSIEFQDGKIKPLILKEKTSLVVSKENNFETMPETVSGENTAIQGNNDYKVNKTKAINFKRWFGDWEKAKETGNYDNVSKIVDVNNGQPSEMSSKVVDKDGNPLMMFHGAKGSFDSFDISRFGKTDSGWFGKGFYFTQHIDSALRYSRGNPIGNMERLIEFDQSKKEYIKKNSINVALAEKQYQSIDLKNEDKSLRDSKSIEDVEHNLKIYKQILNKFNSIDISTIPKDKVRIHDIITRNLLRDIDSIDSSLKYIKGDISQERVKKVYLNIKNPFYIDGTKDRDSINFNKKQVVSLNDDRLTGLSNKYSGNIYMMYGAEEFTNLLRSKGFDGVIVFDGNNKLQHYVSESDDIKGEEYQRSSVSHGYKPSYVDREKIRYVEVVAFENKQIKAVENSGEFDESDPSIYKSLLIKIMKSNISKLKRQAIGRGN